ncbi:double-strand-break repair protein rad21-like protein 1 isoform X1 [Alligator mississippiensis]|uniref:double-strand-break repair protein rad21-like protein 1 isoform X1 n=1 Tax=Alligator mississippiensis TaxID=8496 RepID=UPI0007117777|nr:double-strand-break repair protein rad21-like protein 1 isoform X1 [Alligator mississippiensis]XP_019339308.1 double-strand-break repair protein rad21-like protein 1 isoform X1 [Alligator mississippiensis]XP_059569131.1 double-strand-break repair protein rad21-like protein 1 isoform X1 [Alligator mississippiensis]
MFYMHLLVNKREPLAKIWLAAHWEKKLTRAHIFECNLEMTIEKIVSPKVRIALRTSGHLLLGVVRIYHRKTKYLLADCSEALVKMKMAFRPGLVDLPKENFEATYRSITLPEDFHDFDTPLPDLNAIDVAEHFCLNQSRAEDITLREDYGRDILLCEGNFGEETAILRQHNFFDDSILISTNSLLADHNSSSLTGDKSRLCEDAYIFKLDGFGDEEAAGDMIDDLLKAEQNSLIKDLLDLEEVPFSQELPGDSAVVHSSHEESLYEAENHPMSETVLLPDEEEGFALEPVDATVFTGWKEKRKRKLLVDVVKELSSKTIQKQLSNYTDTETVLDLAPPTKRLMKWKKSGGVHKLLSRATEPLINVELQKLFANCFKYHGFKTGSKNIEMGSEEPEREQDTKETLVIEEPLTEDLSYSQDAAHGGPQGPIMDDSFVSTTLQNSRNGTTNEKTQDMLSALSEACSLESEIQQAELTASPRQELIRNDQDSEEKRWSKRTLQILNTLQHVSNSGVKSFSLLELCQSNDRKQVAAKFYSFLVLKKQLALELSQSAPYADIIASMGPKFNTI